MIADLKELADHVHEAAAAATRANIAVKAMQRERELLFKSIHEVRLAALDLVDLKENGPFEGGPQDWDTARNALLTALIRLPAVQPGVDFDVDDNYNGVHEH